MQGKATSTMIVLVLVLVVGLASCPNPLAAAAAAASRDSDDVACLREFKEAVTDPLGYLKNWDFRGPREINICNFIGVTCVSPDEPKVLKLDVAAAGLGGRISTTLFRKCSSLRELNLSNNFFTGRVPPTLCVHNRNLVTLDASNNGFSGPLSTNLLRCLESNKRQFLDNQRAEEISHGSIELPSDAGREEDIQ
ncbi:unnamed protein product [Calypogeia fissa]